MTCCLLVTFFLPIAAGQEAQTATWSGTLNAGGTQLRIEVDITSIDGKLSGELRSLDQGNAKLPATEISLGAGKMVFSIPQIGAKFTGKLADDGATAEGVFNQGGVELPLTLFKSGSMLNQSN